MSADGKWMLGAIVVGVIVTVLVVVTLLAPRGSPTIYPDEAHRAIATQIYEMRQDIHSLQTQVAKQDSR